MRDYGTVWRIANSASENLKVIPENSSLGQICGWVGSNLSRPECVLAHQSGLLLVPNWSGNGGISLLSPSGDTHHILANHTQSLRPNGIALENGGSVLLAHLGEKQGGIYRMYPNGEVESVVETVNGQPMPPANFVIKDSSERIWITVSTRKTPRSTDYRPNANTGFIAVAEAGSSDARIVADGLGYTNECVIDEIEGHIWVNETFGRRLTRFNLSGHANTHPELTHRTVVCEFGEGIYPDGLALDEEGGLWVTSIVSNRILRVSTDGTLQLMYKDSDQQHVEWVETAFINNSLGREHLDKARGKHMKNISNIAFGGPQLDKIYVGNLLGHSLPWLDAPCSGVAMPHWSASLGALSTYLS